MVRPMHWCGQPELLEQLEARLTANGIQVHWARTRNRPTAIIRGILRPPAPSSRANRWSRKRPGTQPLPRAARYRGVESDLGEYIIQLAKEPPSHIVTGDPQEQGEVAELFHRFYPDIPYTEDIDQLTQSARLILRHRFAAADAGIPGQLCGRRDRHLCLVENEGNGRLSTTAPLHIAITGVEKVVEKLSDVPPLLGS